MKGKVVSIHIAKKAGVNIESVQEAELVAGRGIIGDRKFQGSGKISKIRPDRELTLIEAEQIEHFISKTGLELNFGSLRRNVVTRGVSLNDLVGMEFTIDEVRVKGIQLCEPCKRVANLTVPEVLLGFVHRGVLRASILIGGTVCVGDEIIISTGGRADGSTQNKDKR